MQGEGRGKSQTRAVSSRGERIKLDTDVFHEGLIRGREVVRHDWREGVCVEGEGGSVIVGKESELKVWTRARQQQCPECYETGRGRGERRVEDRKVSDV